MLIVPYPPGGGTETDLKVQVNVVERVGADGFTGNEAIVKAAPDGYMHGSFLRRRALRSAA